MNTTLTFYLDHDKEVLTNFVTGAIVFYNPNFNPNNTYVKIPSIWFLESGSYVVGQIPIQRVFVEFGGDYEVSNNQKYEVGLNFVLNTTQNNTLVNFLV